MFARLKKVGMPGGPFAEPRTLYTTESGTGKYHLRYACGSGVPTTPHQVALWDIDPLRLCGVCITRDRLPESCKSYLRLTDDLAGPAESARAALDDPDPDKVPESGWRTSELDNYVLWDAFTHPHVLRDDAPADLADWVRDVLAPAAAAVRDRWERRLPGGQLPDRFARMAATHRLLLGSRPPKDTWRPADLPALCSRSREHQWETDCGQDGVVDVVRHALVEAYTAGATVEEAQAAAAGAGVARLEEAGGPDYVDQVPADSPVPVGATSVGQALLSVWFGAAAGEVATVAAGFAAVLEDGRRAVLDGPLVAVSWGVGSGVGIPVRGLTATIVRSYAVDWWGAGTVLTFMPAAVLEYLRYLASTRDGHHLPHETWGEVEEGDTPKLYADAHALCVQMDLSPADALTTARAVATPLAG